MTAALTIEDPAYFARLARVEAEHWWSLGMWRLGCRWLTRALGERRGLRALDIGCGAGLTVARLAALPQVAEAIGLEPSEAALAHARHQSARLVRGSALALPFAGASFDLVTCLDVFQHLPPGLDRAAAWEVKRVLRPGGVVLLRTNARGLGGSGRAGSQAYLPNALHQVIRSAGLTIRFASRANCVPSLLQEVRGRLPARRPVQAHPDGGGLRIEVPRVWHNRAMRAISEGEAFLAGRLGVSLPFGHSLLILAENASEVSRGKEP